MADIGIRAGYPNLPLSTKLRSYLALTRPFTLLGPIVGVIAAVGMALEYGHTTPEWLHANWRLLLHGTATLLLAQIGSNYVNQATDGEDAVNRPYRPVVRAVVTRDEALTLGHLCWFLAILRAATINTAFGVLVVLIVVLSYTYSSPPLRLKKHPWMGNLGVATARGLLGITSAWTILAPVTAHEPWLAGAVLFTFLLGATTAKDYADARGDAEYGVRTLVVAYGPHRATKMSLPFVLSPIVTLYAASAFDILSFPAWCYLASIIACAMLAWSMLASSDRPNVVLEGTRPWALMYAALLVLMVTLGVQGYIHA